VPDRREIRQKKRRSHCAADTPQPFLQRLAGGNRDALTGAPGKLTDEPLGLGVFDAEWDGVDAEVDKLGRIFLPTNQTLQTEDPDPAGPVA